MALPRLPAHARFDEKDKGLVEPVQFVPLFPDVVRLRRITSSKELRESCRKNRAKLGEALSEAICDAQVRFMGEGRLLHRNPLDRSIDDSSFGSVPFPQSDSAARNY